MGQNSVCLKLRFMMVRRTGKRTRYNIQSCITLGSNTFVSGAMKICGLLSVSVCVCQYLSVCMFVCVPKHPYLYLYLCTYLSLFCLRVCVCVCRFRYFVNISSILLWRYLLIMPKSEFRGHAIISLQVFVTVVNYYLCKLRNLPYFY